MRDERLNGNAVSAARIARAENLEPAVVDASGAARLLNMKSAQTFYSVKRRLEKNGFPKKLPGINGWSKPCILRWVETNGESYMPAETGQPVEYSGSPLGIIASLEGEYAR